MNYQQNMQEGQKQAERGSTLHAVGAVFDAWQWEEKLPPDAEAQARELYALANKNRHKDPASPNVPIDPDFALMNLKWRHAQQQPDSPWSSLRDTAAP